MSKVIGLLCSFVVAVCLVGCGGSGGGSVMEDASQDDIQAYEEEMAQEEAMMEGMGDE